MANSDLIRRSRLTVVVLFLFGLGGAALLLWRGLPASGARGEGGTAGSVPSAPANSEDLPVPKPKALPAPLPQPARSYPKWPQPLVSSRYARVSSETFAEYVERYAVKDWAYRAHLQREAQPKGRLTAAQQEEAELAARKARAAPTMGSLRRLYEAVASYRSLLVARTSPHVAELYEHELVLLAMLSDGVQPADAVSARACLLVDPPRDCVGVGCGAWEHLSSVARTLCEDPLAWVPKADPDGHVLGLPRPP